MTEWAASLQATPLAQGLRAGAWAYPLVNLGHVLGVALLFGAAAALDLRLLGLWRGVPVGALARPLVPVAAAGLGLALLTGAALFTVQAVDYAENPLFLVKFAAIGLGVANVALTHRLAEWRGRDRGGAEPSGRLALAGAASLLCWLLAASAGRLVAYW